VFLLTFVGGLIATASMVHVASATIIQGSVGENASITPVASSTGGKVAEVLVHDGDLVRPSQDLFVLSDDGLVGQRVALNDQLAAYIIRNARITEELAGGTTVELPAELTSRGSESAVVSAMQLEQQQMSNDASSLAAAIQALQAQLTSQQRTLETLKQEQNTAKDSAADPSFTGTPASAYASQIDMAVSQTTQISAQMQQTRAAARTSLLGSATETQTALSDIRLKVAQVDTQLADLHVKAPGRGTVTESILAKPGQYLPPSATAMNIVGGVGGLVVTARLPVADAPFASQGDRVSIDLTTGDKLRTTSVKGQIATISANPSSKGKSAATYAVRITVSTKETKSVRDTAALTNGMPVQVHIESGSQSILDYLIAPIAERMRFAFHER
jgi:multidrug efflux pump subunit AcrA (membrane-fusion protein)